MPLPLKIERGFTLVETIAIIAITAVLAAIILYGLNRVKSAAQTVQCVANQRQLIIAYQLKITDDQGKFPPSRLQRQPSETDPTQPGSAPVPRGYLHSMLAEYIPNPLLAYEGRAANLPTPEDAGPYWCPGRDPSQTDLTTPGTANPIYSYGHNAYLGGAQANPAFANFDPRFAYLAAVNNPEDIIVFADHTAPGLTTASYLLDNSWPLPTGSSRNPGPTHKRIDMSRHDGAAVAAFLDGSVRRLTYDDIAETGGKHINPQP